MYSKISRSLIFEVRYQSAKKSENYAPQEFGAIRYIISIFAHCVRARVVFRVNGTGIRTSCSPHPLIVDCLLAPPLFKC